MNKELLEKAQEAFKKAAFVHHIGIEPIAVGKDYCESMLTIEERHGQANAFVHAGVLATIADHTAAAAVAFSHLKEGQGIVSVEFKINLLRPAVGNYLYCKATVLKAGKTLSVAESEVYTLPEKDTQHAEKKLVAKATITLATI